MVRIENHCCNCATGAYPCLGSTCPRRRVEVHYCDKCGAELEEHEIHDCDLVELCDSCREEMEEESC